MRDDVYQAHGQALTLKQWAEQLDIKYKTLWARIKNGALVEEALSKKMPKKERERNPEKTITKACRQCAKSFVIPQCRDWREHCCSSKCKKEFAENKARAAVASRTRSCKACGTEFVARATQIEAGGGNYCSVKCHFHAYGMRALHAPDVQKVAAARMRSLRLQGQVRYAQGERNAKWSGGKVASKERAMQNRKANPGAVAAALRAYRKANPEKAREWTQRRKDRKLGKLPRFTIKKIYAAQRGFCPVCRASLKNGYHVDHIQPLARGGHHIPLNIQLLCAPCNLNKSAKDPIAFMQEKGFLL